MAKKDSASAVAPSAPKSTEKIEEERLAYLGGTPDSIDTENLSGEDRGDLADPALIEAAAKKKEEDEAAAAAEKEVADAEAVAKKEVDDKEAEDKKEAVAKAAADKKEAVDKAAADKKEKDDAKAKDEGKDKEGTKDDVAGKDGDTDDEKAAKEAADKEADAAAAKKVADAEAAKTGDQQKPSGIPKSRFDQVNERRRIAEEELARRDAAVVAAKDAEDNKYDFDKAEDEYIEFMLDGKKEEAKAKRTEIRTAEKAEWKSEAITESTTTVAEQQSIADVADLTDQAQDLYPVFDQTHADFNPEITAKTLAFYQGYRVTKPEGVKNDSDAMVMAIADTIQLYDLDTIYHPEEGKGEQTEEEKAAAEKAAKDAEETKKLDPKKDIEKKLKDAEQQGTPVIKGGEGSQERGAAVPNIDDMSDEEFDALPAATLARMRGDDAG